ncbi:MAG: hypothetical protein JWM38_2578, partial [Sphingomonas bacterium]|nr:hypothetical protein [Sphingomonas bacterium]
STGLLLALMAVLPLWFGGVGAGFAVLAGSALSFAMLWQVMRTRPRG